MLTPIQAFLAASFNYWYDRVEDEIFIYHNDDLSGVIVGFGPVDWRPDIDRAIVTAYNALPPVHADLFAIVHLPDRFALSEHSWLGDDDNGCTEPADADVNNVALTICEDLTGSGDPDLVKALENRIRQLCRKK